MNLLNLISKPAFAQICNPLLADCTQVTNPASYTNKFIQFIVTIFIIVAVLYFVWHFVMAGYHWMSSSGDVKKIEQAKQELTYSLLGLLVVFSVFAITKFVGLALGVKGLQNLQLTWPTL